MDGAFHVQGPVDAPPDDVLQALLREWYRTTARKDFAERLKRWSHRVGVTYQSFRVKDQKSRWGSCSSAGNINLNWRLVMAPEDAIDYVVVHELCHRLEMNHSPAFWAHVERAFPAYRQARRWLRDHGAQLMAVQL